VHCVQRTPQSIVVADAARDERFAGDPYVIRRRSRALLCMPLLKQGELCGVLCLENDLVADAFTPERVEVLQLLGTQMAISLENARLLLRERDARRAAEAAIAQRDELFLVASHELNTPMAALSLSHDAMRRAHERHPLPAVQLAHLARAERQTSRLRRLVADLVGVSQGRMAPNTLAREHLELGALVRAVATSLHDEVARAHCSLRVEAPRPVYGAWDRALLVDVVANLIGNALKFGQRGEIVARVERRSERAILSVIDHGIGVDPALRERIFERYGRGVSTEHFGGLGIGLFVVKSIVEAHGGSVHVENTPGSGATFVVDLPAATLDTGIVEGQMA
jgi:signal transduction histidine kinase